MKSGIIFLMALCANVFWNGATSAYAQTPVVVVDIKAVANQVAKNISVDASRLPLTVQVPVEVAAEVCGIAESVLRTQGGAGAAGCAAAKTSPEMERIVRSKIGK